MTDEFLTRPSVPSNTSEIKFMVTSILSETPGEGFVIPEEEEEIRDVLIDLAKYIRFLEKELTRLKRQDAYAQSTPPSTAGLDMESGSGISPENEVSGEESGRSETQILTEQVAKLQVTRVQNQHFGKSSNPLFFMQVLNLKKYPDVVKRPEFWSTLPFEYWESAVKDPPAFQFPDDAHLRDLTTTYFTFHHPYYPLLHRATFEKALSEGLHHRDYQFGQLVLVLCSVASRYTEDPRNLPQPHTSSLSFGWRWFQQINLFKRPMVPVSLHELQALCLAICFLQTTNQSDFAWVLIGLGIRFSQQRGLHRRKFDAGGGKQISKLENELWKTAFWMLFSHDIYMSSALGRPVATSVDDFDTEPLVVEREDEGWSNDPDKSPAAFWNFYLPLLEILSFVEQTLSSVRRSELSERLTTTGSNWNQMAVIEIDSALNDWLKRLPNHLKWDPRCGNEVFLTQSSALYTTFYWIQIRVHRLFIPRQGDEATTNSLSSVAVCINAARSCIDVLDVLQKRNPRAAYHFPFSAAAYNSAIIVLLNIFRGKELKLLVDLRKEISDIYRCVGFFREWEAKHAASGRLRDILITIFGHDPLSKTSNSKENLSLPDSQRSQRLKRPRDEMESKDESGFHPILGTTSVMSSVPSTSTLMPSASKNFGSGLGTSDAAAKEGQSILDVRPVLNYGSGGSSSDLASADTTHLSLHTLASNSRGNQEPMFHPMIQRHAYPSGVVDSHSGWESDASILRASHAGIGTSADGQLQDGSSHTSHFIHTDHRYDSDQDRMSIFQNDPRTEMHLVPSHMHYNPDYNYLGAYREFSDPSNVPQDAAQSWDTSMVLDINSLYQWYSGHTA
ncbi:Gypsy retrotransposon integrase-like protein 1 [Stygiomarasmius scandens]|uniref:Gypsy retrotransposon integrase-like protein 1 n=1 Tax=Marasmiellus scandens TaxID=2682957 RepID=A0ABR1JR10_9AGAR